MCMRIWKEGEEQVTQGAEGTSWTDPDNLIDKRETIFHQMSSFIQEVGYTELNCSHNRKIFRKISRCLEFAFTQSFFT